MDARGVTGEILRFGVYEKFGIAESFEAKETAAGYVSAIDAKHLKETTLFHLQKDQGIGFEYRLYKIPDIKIVQV